MTERQNNNQNPTNVWQGIWANLFYQIIQQMTTGNYGSAWETMQLLKKQIPPECEEDVNAEYSKVEKIMYKKVEGFSCVDVDRIKKNQICHEAPPAIRNLLGLVRKSLYDRKWINRPDFNAQPKYEKKGHL